MLTREGSGLVGELGECRELPRRDEADEMCDAVCEEEEREHEPHASLTRTPDASSVRPRRGQFGPKKKVLDRVTFVTVAKVAENSAPVREISRRLT